MTLFDLFLGKKNKKVDDKLISSDIKFNNKNIVYPKNDKENEIKELYNEINNYNKIEKSEKLKNRYVSNALKNNRYLQKQQSTFVSDKQKYKKLEDNFNKLMEKGDNIFIKDDNY